ncbi:H2.0-Like Homeobox Protein, partial [Manis pentadactyla]
MLTPNPLLSPGQTAGDAAFVWPPLGITRHLHPATKVSVSKKDSWSLAVFAETHRQGGS